MVLDITPLNRIDDINFRFVEPEDAKFIWDLRNHSFKSRHLHAVGSTEDEQKKWIKQYKKREKRGEEHYFIIENDQGTPLGTLRLYDIEDDSATYGSWIFKDEAPKNMAVIADLLLKTFLFDNMKIIHLYFETRKKNRRVHLYSLLQGAEEIKEDNENYYFYLSREAFIKGKENLQKMFDIEVKV